VLEAVREAAVAVWRGGRVLLMQRQPHERWAGLWDFPRFELPRTGRADLAAEVERLTGLAIETRGPLATFRHGVTRFRITLECHEARYVKRVRQARQSPQRWIAPGAMEELPCHVTGRKFARLLAKRLGAGSAPAG
jgi:A/G-specific adenine glycosylase